MRRLRPVGIPDEVQQAFCRQPHVPDDALADRGARRFLRVVSDVNQARPRGDGPSGNKSVVPEDGRAEVIFGVNDLASTLCADSGFQTSGGYSVAECQKRYANYKEMCESRIFEGAPETYSRPEDVKAAARAYVRCVGIK